MFRDNSEMAVAISVASPDENPTRDANARPCWRAATMSLSTLIGTTVSSAKARAPPSIARDVDHDDLGAIDPDAAEQLLGELTRALRVDDANDREDQQSLAHRQHRGRELADRFLLLADDPLALLDKAHGHRIGDAVGGRLIGVLDTIELREVCPIPGEQRAREHVAQQQHDPHDLVGFHSPRNDALRQAAGVGFQRLDRPGLQGLQVVVVDGRGFGENLIRRHRGQQLGLSNAPGPLLTELSTVLSQVGYQLAQQYIRGSEKGVTERFRSDLNHGEPPRSEEHTSELQSPM